MKWFKRIGLTILVFFVLCVIACASGSLFSNIVDNPSTPEQTELSKDLDKVLNTSNNVEVEPIVITAQELIKAYEDHEPKADEKYLNKPLIVKGIITEFTTVLGVTTITLGTGEEFEITQITCMFNKDNESQVLELEKGQEIIINGICNGKGFNVELKDCEIK